MEIDSPAHMGYGWQWGKEAGYGDMVVCLGKHPWWDYCVQPPCGQLNPLNNNAYVWLGRIYKDLIDVFPKGETFHMGGDEVIRFACSKVESGEGGVVVVVGKSNQIDFEF